MGFDVLLNADAGLLAAYAVSTGALSGELLLKQLVAEVERLAHEPVLPEELAKAKAQLLNKLLLERETPEGRALALGHALLLRGDASLAERELAQLQAVGVADVQRALRRHVLQAAKVSVLYGDKR